MTAAVLPQTHAARARAYVERGRRFHADGDMRNVHCPTSLVIHLYLGEP